MKVKEIWPVQSKSPSIVSFFKPIAKRNVIRFATSSTPFIPNENQHHSLLLDQINSMGNGDYDPIVIAMTIGS